MPSRFASLLAAGFAALGCARPVSVSPAAVDRLRSSPDIPIVYRPSAAPWVDCPGDFAVETWKKEASLWESVQAQRTESLRRSPPVDPARATADRLLLLSRATPGAPAFRDHPLLVGDVHPDVLARRFGATPVLVLETTRWVLVGCFYLYQPWYNVRATLVEAQSGRILWRDGCGGLYPPDPYAEASPGELEAHGKALYGSMMEARASRCAGELLARLGTGLRAVGGETGPAPR